MSQLPSKLKHKLNTMLHELGDYKLGNVIQECLDEINGNSSGGLVMTKYASTAAYEAANGSQKTNGGFFINSTTNNIVYCCNGQYFEIDLASIQAQITANAQCCALNAADIVNINAALTALQNAFATHNHDGVNSPLIEIKGQLVTGGINGQVLGVNNGVVDCISIDDTQDVFFQGALIEGEATGINFIDDCFSVTTVAGVAQVGIPTLKTALTNIQANADCCAANTASIIAINAALATTNANVAQNATDILNLTIQFNSHDHTGGTNGPILDPTQSLHSTGEADCFLLASDGAGNVVWKNPSTFSTNVTICGKSIGAATASDIFLQVDPADDCLDFRKIAGGCGIALSTDPTDNHLVVDIDFVNMQDIGTAVDPNNDFILVHDVSTGECVKTSVSNLIPAAGAIIGGKLIDVTTAGANTTLDVDFTNVTNVQSMTDFANDNGFLIGYNPSDNECYRVDAQDIYDNWNFDEGKLITIDHSGNTVEIGVDFTTVTGISTLTNLENNGGFLLAYDAGVQDCVRINPSEFLMANLGITGGKLLNAVTSGNSVALDVDLTSVTAVTQLQTLQTNGGFLLGYDPATNDCTRLNVSDLACQLNDLKDVCVEADNSVNIIVDQATESGQIASVTVGNDAAASFTPVLSSSTLTEMTLSISSNAALTGDAQICLTLPDGAGLPDPAAIFATSNLLNVTGLPSGSGTPSTFTFPTPYSLTAGTTYIVIVKLAAGTTGSLSVKGVNPSANGETAFFFSNTFQTWNIAGAFDYYIDVQETVVIAAPVAGDTICFDGTKWRHTPKTDKVVDLSDVCTDQTIQNCTVRNFTNVPNVMDIGGSNFGAVTFEAEETCSTDCLQVYIGATNGSGTLAINLIGVDGSGDPDSTNVIATSATIDRSILAATGSFVKFTFPAPVNYVQGTQYGIEFDQSGNTGGNLTIHGDPADTAFGNFYFANPNNLPTWTQDSGNNVAVIIEDNQTFGPIADGDILCWNDSLQKFLPQAKPTGTGGGAALIADLTDVCIVPTTGPALANNYNDTSNNFVFSSTIPWGPTGVADVSGDVTNVELCFRTVVQNGSGFINVEVVEIDPVSGMPNYPSGVIGTSDNYSLSGTTTATTPPQLHNITFSTPVPIVAGTQYAYVVRPTSSNNLRSCGGSVAGDAGAYMVASSVPNPTSPNDFSNAGLVDGYLVVTVTETTTGVNDGDVLCYNAAQNKWLPQPKSTGGGGTTERDYTLIMADGSPSNQGNGIATPNVWTTVPFALPLSATPPWITVSSSQFTPQVGCCYKIDAKIPGFLVGRFNTRLVNVITGAPIFYGSVGYSNGSTSTQRSDQTHSFLVGERCVTSFEIWAIQVIYEFGNSTNNTGYQSLVNAAGNQAIVAIDKLGDL